MNSEKILMVEDDAPLANAVLVTLRARGYDVKVATTASAAIKLAAEWHPHALLLDLGLPDMSGLDVLRTLRSWSDMPVLVVSARHDEAGKINALDEGADDYVTKPFAVGELLARLRAALRRAPSEEAEQPVVWTSDGRVAFDLPEKRVTVDGAEVHLTPREWGIAEYLIRHQGRLVTKLELLQAVWGESYKKETNYLRVYMSQLRAKLERDPANPQYFTTELGVGYRMVL
ncbi:response regulator [Corynebacterium auriscanis]|uniref:response regulator n=1 Tax=Corynebacterium auriscanis TaxID=99807 RepID=UPI003CF12EA8